MNTSRLASHYEDSSMQFPALGGFSLDDLDDFGSDSFSSKPSYVAQSQPQYNVIIKRNDGLYRTLNILNTLFSILAVLLIVGIFVMVFYSLVTITEVAHIASSVQEHNAVNMGSPGPR